jgi:hypothetical protein
MTLSDSDRMAVEAQLGREIRGALEVAHRCWCGRPDVVTTAPRLPDGTPFPTLYYLTCPRAASAIGTLEADGHMRLMQDELAADDQLARHYAAAHDSYLATRESLGHVPEIAGISAGGMPTRVKCLHVLAAHSLAVGPGINPLGDRVLAMIGDYARSGSCIEAEPCE